jgi:hypothetical protein
MTGPRLARRVVGDEQIQHQLTRGREGLDHVVGGIQRIRHGHRLADLIGQE